MFSFSRFLKLPIFGVVRSSRNDAKYDGEIAVNRCFAGLGVVLV